MLFENCSILVELVEFSNKECVFVLVGKSVCLF